MIILGIFKTPLWLQRGEEIRKERKQLWGEEGSSCCSLRSQKMVVWTMVAVKLARKRTIQETFKR